MDLNLADSVVIITGGTDGLGAALARRLVEERARVAVCGRDPGRVEAVGTALSSAGGEVLAMSADVTRTDQVEAFVAAVTERWGRIDGLVNNAGASATGTIADITDEAWSADLDLKVRGPARFLRAALPHLRSAPAPAIVNVLAIAAKAAPENSMPSSASRAAGLAMTKALSRDLGPSGVRVNAVLVGLVESGQWRRKAAEAGVPEAEFLTNLAAGARIPMGRVGRSDEFADLAAYLLSPRSSYVTGSAVNLDGGLSPAL